MYKKEKGRDLAIPPLLLDTVKRGATTPAAEEF